MRLLIAALMALLMPTAFVACGDSSDGGSGSGSGGSGGGAGDEGGSAGDGGNTGADDDDDDDDDDDNDDDDAAGGSGGRGGSPGDDDDDDNDDNMAANPDCPGEGKEVEVAVGDFKKEVRDLKGGETVKLAAGAHGMVEVIKKFKCATTFTGPGTVTEFRIDQSENIVVEELTINGQPGLMSVQRSDKITMKGLTITADKQCIAVTSTDDVVIDGNNCTSTSAPVLLGTVAKPAIGVSGLSKNLRIINNRITGPGFIDSEEVEHVFGIQLLGNAKAVATDALVANNYITRMWGGIVIGGANGVDVANNTVVNAWVALLESWAATANGTITRKSEKLRIFNNVFSSSQDEYFLRWRIGNDIPHMRASEDITPPDLLSHNFFRSRLRGRAPLNARGGTGDNALTGNAGLSADGAPTAGSQLIDAGMMDPAVPMTDITGKQRSGAPDIGAFEG